MRRFLLCCVLLVSSLPIIASDSMGQQKDGAKQKKKDTSTVTRVPTTPQDYVDLGQVKEITGRIAELSLKAGTMTITLDWTHLEANPNANQAGKGKGNANLKVLQLQQQLQRDYDTIMRTTNAVQRQQALIRYQKELQQLQSSTAKLEKMFKTRATKDFDLEIVADVKVARAELLQKYTAEGEFIIRTPEELKKLKSVEMPNGYTAAATDLMPGQTVLLYLSPPAPPGAKKLDQDAKNQIPRPRVRMAMILDDTPPPPDPKDLPKKKK